MTLLWATRDVEYTSGRIMIVEQHRFTRTWRVRSITPGA